MEYCKVCGSSRNICKNCGAELHKHFDDFIYRAEIIYAIFMAWGFAASAEAVIRAKSWVGLPLLLICGLVLIRFFFAPTRNLYSAALLTEKNKKWRWIIFMLDFPILIFHSFAYYTMCIAVSTGDDNAYSFFQWFIILLSANVFWLLTIAARMHLLGRGKHYMTYIKWCTNNFISVVLFFLVLSALSVSLRTFFGFLLIRQEAVAITPADIAYWVFFSIAILNCIVDVVLTATDYLGFEN